MTEDKTKVVPMMEPESTDPYVFDTATQEFVKIEVTQEVFDKIVDMIDNPREPLQEVVDRFDRYKVKQRKGE